MSARGGRLRPKDGLRVASIGLRARPLRAALSRLTHPVAAWLLFVAATWLWHVPALYELALRSDGSHQLQHACFLGTGLRLANSQTALLMASNSGSSAGRSRSAADIRNARSAASATQIASARLEK